MLNTKKETELKPCPFCGGEPFRYYSGEQGEFLEIVCKKCWCQTPRASGDVVIRVWNRRADNEQRETD